MSILRVSLVLGLVVAASSSGAQISFNPSPALTQPRNGNPQNRYKVTGTVVNSVSGEGIARALVSASGSTSGSVFTDGSGRFELEGVPEGQAFFNVQRPGFFTEEAVHQGRFNATTINASNTTVTLKLVPGASVRGRITDGDGEPLGGLNVRVFRRVLSEGLYSWQQMNGNNTDSDGTFEIANLLPGIYAIQAGTAQVYRFSGALEINGQHVPDIYPSTWFPSGSSRAAAQLITLSPGASAEADMRITAIPSFSISGTVGVGVRASVQCQSDDNWSATAAMVNPETGRFRLTGVPPGTCNLVAQSFSRSDGGQQASRIVEVNGDVENVALTLSGTSIDIPLVVTGIDSAQGGVNVSGRSRNPDGSLGNLFLRQDGPNHGARPLGQGNPVSDSDTPRKFTDVSPGIYHITTTTYGNACLASVTSGGVDLTKDDLAVTEDSTPAPITVALRTDCASLKATIEGAPNGQRWNVLLSGNGAPPRLFIASGDSINLSALSPGDYTVYAFDDVSDLEYGRPEVLGRYSGQHVTVNPNDKATITLKLQTTTRTEGA